MQIEHSVTNETWRAWFENPKVKTPLKDDVHGGADPRLFPRDCREMVLASVSCHYVTETVVLSTFNYSTVQGIDTYVTNILEEPSKKWTLGCSDEAQLVCISF